MSVTLAPFASPRAATAANVSSASLKIRSRESSGSDAGFVLSREHPQDVVTAGRWFGARVEAGGTHGYSLLGCTVSPGFDFADFEMGDRAYLLATYPRAREIILAMTRPE